MSNPEQSPQGAQTPPEDLCRIALEHYDEVSLRANCWYSTIPHAIRFWYLERPKLQQELVFLQERVKILEARSRRLIDMLPLFEEARDALPAIQLAEAKLRGIQLDLADRMDAVGNPESWLKLDQGRTGDGL